MVDGFKFQSPRCRHYFLTHYHADHTIGAFNLQTLHAGIAPASYVPCRPDYKSQLTSSLGFPNC